MGVQKAVVWDDSDDDVASTAASTVAAVPVPAPVASRTPPKAHAEVAVEKACGRVKVFFEEKDYGFIALESGSDVFFHSESLDEGVFVERNDIVEVRIWKDQSGKERVYQVKLIKKATSKVSGRVKAFFDEKDYGFIVLASGDEVFFHSNSLDAGVSVGWNDIVEVSISENQSGKVRVNHVELIKKATSKVRGRVKVFFDKKNHGFIALESGDEVFFHTRSLDAGVSVGRNDIVEVSLSEDRSGKVRVNHVDLIKKATLMRLMCRNPKCKGTKPHFEDSCRLGFFMATS